MNSEPQDRSAGHARILLTLDNVTGNAEALELAAAVAAGLGAEIVGLLNEDPELILAADLPAARLIPQHGRGEFALDAALMRRALGVRADHARRTLSLAAERARARWSFRVVSGIYSEQVLAETGKGDIITVVARERTALRRSVKNLDMIVSKSACSVFFVRQKSGRGGEITVLYQGSPGLLDVAKAMAATANNNLRIFAIGKDAAAAAELEARAREWTAAHHLPGRTTPVTAEQADSLGDILLRQHPHALLADKGAVPVPFIESGRWIDELGCSVFLLR